jgi:hypothetical protein
MRRWLVGFWRVEGVDMRYYGRIRGKRLVGNGSGLLVNPRLKIETWGTRPCHSFQS